MEYAGVGPTAHLHVASTPDKASINYNTLHPLPPPPPPVDETWTLLRPDRITASTVYGVNFVYFLP